MTDDDLTTTPVQRGGWGKEGNYAITPRVGRGKPQLNPQPVGGGNRQSLEGKKEKKTLTAQPVGKQPRAPRKEGGGLQLAPVGGQGGGVQNAPSVPMSVPSTNMVDEWDEVTNSDTPLHAPSTTPSGGDSNVSPTGEDEGWESVDGEFTPGGESNTSPQGGDVTSEGEGSEGWESVDGEFTPGSVTPPRKRKMGVSVYPPGFGGEAVSPAEGALSSPYGGGDTVVSSDEDEWGSVDGEFAPAPVVKDDSRVSDGDGKGKGKSKGKGKGKRSSGGGKKNTQQVKNRVKPLMSVSKDDGWDDDNPAMSKEGIKNEEELKSFISSSSKVRITERDIRIIRFLARYRYAQGIQVARFVGSSKRAIEQRLTKLGNAGLLRREDVTKGQSLWTPTGWGLSTADLDYTAIGAGKISYVTIAHTLGLVNLGIELETAGENILEIPDSEFPRHRRFEDNELVAGETVITEREIRQAESRWKKSHARIDIERAFPQALQEWRSVGDTSIPSPELEVGNEAMLVLWATKSGRSDHVPDMVVAGERGADGRTSNIAIELELTAKSMKEWERVLGTYADGRDLYGEVHYYTHKRTIADALQRVANNVGLREDEFFVHRYVPQQGNLPFWG